MLDARPVTGPFRQLRWAANAILIAILIGLPWVRIRGEPAILLDIPQRKFHVFGLVIFPQELYFLWLIVAGLALALFFFTALLGRIWCGWACPQTVFTDVFAAVARRIQGWTAAGPPRDVAAWRRAATHAVWILLSVTVGFHLVAYFKSPYAMLDELRAGQMAGAWVGFWVVMSGLSYLDFVVVRQLFCKVLCPYARFQSVLFDRDTLVVAYDPGRGEPRGKLGATEGDCVDCGLCVAVCPTGIDIREGLQLECIACTQCIDACNGVMYRVGRSPNLIGYRSLASVEDRRPARPLRPRAVAYGLLLIAAFLAFATAVGRRMPLDFQVQRNTEALYQTAADGRIGNAYTLHIENRDREDHAYSIGLEGPGAFQLVTGVNPLPVPATTATEAKVFVLVSRDSLHRTDGSRELRLVLEQVGNSRLRVTRPVRFVAPREPLGGRNDTSAP